MTWTCKPWFFAWKLGEKLLVTMSRISEFCPKILKHFYNSKSVKICLKSIKLLPQYVVSSKFLPLSTKKWLVLTYLLILSTVHNEKKRYTSFWTKFEIFDHSVAAAFWSAQHPHQQVVQHEHAGCSTVGKFATLCSEKSFLVLFSKSKKSVSGGLILSS